MDAREIQEINREYHEKLYANELDKENYRPVYLINIDGKSSTKY